jgi:hypothetical protein
MHKQPQPSPVLTKRIQSFQQRTKFNFLDSVTRNEKSFSFSAQKPVTRNEK